MHLDDDEIALVRMTIQRVENEAAVQLLKTSDCDRSAWFCTRLCLSQLRALRERIEQWRKDKAEEKADGSV